MNKSSLLKSLGKLVAGSVALGAIVWIPKAIMIKWKLNRNKEYESLLNKHNTELNEHFDRYAKSGMETKPGDEREYKKVLTKATAEIIRLAELKGTGDTAMERAVEPFLGLLRVLLIRDIVILTGSEIGADRRDFELVYAPGQTALEVEKDPYRNKVYTHSWSSVGYQSSSYGAKDANRLISDTIDFLSKNPKYLTIRV